MSKPSEVLLTNVTVGDLQSNPRGGKSAQVLADGKQIKLKLRGVTTPFPCTSYDKTSTRRALDVRTDPALKDFCARLDAALLPFAKKLTCQEAGYKTLAKAQKEGFEPLFRQKITLDDDGKTPVKFYDENKKRLTPEQIAAIEWREVSLDINLAITSVFVNAGNWGAVACPQSILVRSHDVAEFSGGEDESFD
jgi:hypothetical protein